VEITTHDHDPATQAAVADRARQVLTDAGVAVLSANPVGRIGDVVDGHVYVAGYTLLIVAVVIAIAGCTGMASALSSGVLERTREFGIMHAIGAPPSAVRWIVTVEGLVTATAGLLAAIPLAAAVGIGLSDMVGRMIGGDPLPLQVSPLAVGSWVVVVLAGAVLATLPPAGRASRLTVREALTHL
jgi:putative ABC transport system permease protein